LTTLSLLFLQHRNDDNNMVSTHTATKATEATTSTLSKQQQDYHRARLLNRLGIHDDTQQQQQQQQQQSNKSNKRQRVVRPIILTAAEQRQQQILRSRGGGYIINPSPRDDGGNIRSPETGVKLAKTNLNCDFSHLPVAATTKTKTTEEEEEEKKGTRITFCEKVDVVLIPTRHEYSNRIKSLIWSDPQELQENAMRNTREFAAEDWKWENAIEDESMYVCSFSGELIHPIHMQHHLVPA